MTGDGSTDQLVLESKDNPELMPDINIGKVVSVRGGVVDVHSELLIWVKSN